MTEKEMLLDAWEREYQITLKVLNAYPKEKLDFKPHEKSKSARELAWWLASGEDTLVGGVVKGTIDFGHHAGAPASLAEMIAEYQRSHKAMVEKVKKMTDQDFNRSLKFPVGPKRMGDFRGGDILRLFLMDQVHHRGQFSVYLRMAGGKVPSIYGPSADEPWM